MSSHRTTTNDDSYVVVKTSAILPLFGFSVEFFQERAEASRGSGALC